MSLSIHLAVNKEWTPTDAAPDGDEMDDDEDFTDEDEADENDGEDENEEATKWQR